MLVSSRRRPFRPLPLHECYMSQSEDAGMITAVVTRKRPDGELQALFILLDLWKKGMRDCFMDSRISMEQFQEKARKLSEPHPIIETKIENIQRLVKYALRIAREVKTEIPWEYQYWSWMLGDMRNVPELGGSLYKCPKCGDDLPQQTVDLMKEHAQSDDIQFYILCRKCGGEFD